MFSFTAEIYDAIFAFQDAGEILKIWQLIARERLGANEVVEETKSAPAQRTSRSLSTHLRTNLRIDFL